MTHFCRWKTQFS